MAPASNAELPPSTPSTPIGYFNLAKSRLSQFADVSAFSAAESIKRASEFIDTEMDTLRKLLGFMALRRNSMSQDQRLPPEILSRIFRMAADSYLAADADPFEDDENEDCESSGPGPDDLQHDPLGGWLQFTHVCRRWRDVALEDLTLWTDVTYTCSTRWLDAIFSRARSAPVVLHRQMAWPHRRSERNLIRGHLSQLKELLIIAPPPSLASIGSALSQPAPILESLMLSTCRTTGEHASIQTDIAKLPEDIFAACAPKLRRISLSNCYLPWISPLFTDFITHFDLSYPLEPEWCISVVLHSIDTNRAKMPRCRELFACLQKMPALQSLILKHSLPLQTSSCGVLQPCEFSFLCSLQLEGLQRRCTEFMKHIRIPSTTIVTLSCREGRVSSPPFTTYNELFTNQDPFIFLDASVSSRHGRDRLEVKARRTIEWNDDSTIRIKAPELSIELTSSQTCALDMLRLTCSTISLQELRYLCIRSKLGQTKGRPQVWTAGYWSLVFSQCTALTDLIVLSGQVAQSLFEALTIPSGVVETDTSASNSGALFGAMRRLDLDFIRKGDPLTEKSMEDLHRQLVARKQAGLGLKRLNIGAGLDVELWQRFFADVTSVSGLLRRAREGV